MSKSKLGYGPRPIIRSKYGGPVFRVSAKDVKLINLGIESNDTGIEYTAESGGGADIGNVIHAKRGIVDRGQGNVHAFNVIKAGDTFVTEGKKWFGWVILHRAYFYIIAILGFLAIDYALAWRNLYWLKGYSVMFLKWVGSL